MKVLRTGAERKYRVDCCECDAQLEYQKEDINERKVPIFGGSAVRSEKYVICPECKNEIV